MKKILFATDVRDDWGLYMPHLLRLAQEQNAGIHVLLTSAPLGTGDFTVNPTQNEPVPLETVNPAVRDVNPSDRPANLTAPDIAVAAANTNAYVDELVSYFRSAGFETTGDWQPDFNREHLDVYARQLGADTIAVFRRGPIAELLQGNYVRKLEGEGFQVVELEEAKL